MVVVGCGIIADIADFMRDILEPSIKRIMDYLAFPVVIIREYNGFGPDENSRVIDMIKPRSTHRSQEYWDDRVTGVREMG